MLTINLPHIRKLEEYKYLRMKKTKTSTWKDKEIESSAPSPDWSPHVPDVVNESDPDNLLLHMGNTNLIFHVRDINSSSYWIRAWWASVKISWARTAKSFVLNRVSCSLILRILWRHKKKNIKLFSICSEFNKWTAPANSHTQNALLHWSRPENQQHRNKITG